MVGCHHEEAVTADRLVQLEWLCLGGKLHVEFEPCGSFWVLAAMAMATLVL